MNALVGIRSTSGLNSANPAQRAAVRRQVYSLVKAGFEVRAKMAREAAGVSAAPKSAAATKAENTSGTDTDPVERTVQRELDRDAFLQLLVRQMQNQDPMDPVDNSQMMAQLAQFSALEQMTNLNESFQAMSGNIDQLNFIAANGLLGREIAGVDMEGNAIQGTVDRVHMDGSIVYLTVGDRLVSMAGVMAIGNAPVATEE